MLFAPKERGQGLVEYALILVLISIAVIVIMNLLGVELNSVFQSIIDALTPVG
jgi:pilus assembly protein Flp/PilA